VLQEKLKPFNNDDMSIWQKMDDDHILNGLVAGGIMNTKLLVAVIFTVFLFEACTSQTSMSGALDTSPAIPLDNQATFKAYEYRFDGPEVIEAGMATVQLTNAGQEPHELQLLKLPNNRTAADLISAVNANPFHFPDWVTAIGGPNSVMPGAQALTIQNLTPGEYLLICMVPVPGPPGKFHFSVGMQKPLRVVASSKAHNKEPISDVKIDELDFKFTPDRPLKAGRHIIHVVNNGKQTHGLQLVQLSAGSTIKDFVMALAPGATTRPPGKSIGGVTGLDSGMQAFFPVDLATGNYGIVCFFRDPQTKVPHFSQGMMLDFTVE